MDRNSTGNAGKEKSRARSLLRIMLLLADDYRPADEMSMAEVLRIVRDHLIRVALKETGGNTAAAGVILGMNRTTLMEHYYRRGGLDGRNFERRRNRKPERQTGGTEPVNFDEEL